MIDLICSTLAPALPDTHYDDRMIFQITGINPRTGELFLDNEPHVGGWGAKFPARITEYGYRQDSAGPGEWRGDYGVIREYTMTTDTEMSLWFERSANPAWGLSAARTEHPPKVIINPEPPKRPTASRPTACPYAKETPSAATLAAEAATATPWTVTPKPTWPTATSPPTTPAATTG